MKKHTVLFVLSIIVVLTLACGTQTAIPPTSTPLPPTLTPSVTRRPTSTPTQRPPTDTPMPTPAPIGDTVRYGALEITLLQVVTHDLIVPGGKYYYSPNPGFIFVDACVLVRNTSSQAVNVSIKDVYVLDSNGKGWYPAFASWKTLEIGTEFDAMNNLKIPEDDTTGDEMVPFEKDTYVRLIYVVTDDQDLLFGIENSPMFAFHVKK